MGEITLAGLVLTREESINLASTPVTFSLYPFVVDSDDIHG